MWDSEDYEIKAMITKDDKSFKEVPLRFSGQPSVFTASLESLEKGTYEIVVYAYNQNNGNTGVDRLSLQVR